MGDRANILVTGNGDMVCLYAHNSGSELPGVLRTALYRGIDRWKDLPYLTRIIFSEMIRDDIDGLTGYGISQNVMDGADRVITVDVDNQSVSIGGRNITFFDYVNYNHGWEEVDAPKPSKYGQKELAFAAFPCCADDSEARFQFEEARLYASLAAEAFRIGWRLDSDGKAVPPDGQAFDEYKLPVYSLEESKICAKEMKTQKRLRFISKRCLKKEPWMATFTAPGGSDELDYERDYAIYCGLVVGQKYRVVYGQKDLYRAWVEVDGHPRMRFNARMFGDLDISRLAVIDLDK